MRVGDAKLVVMGVAGCGKSTLGAQLAHALGASLIEGDDYHLPSSQNKMRRGIPLEDRDREPWLDRLGELMNSRECAAVATCSALKRAYRDRLRAKVPGLRFVYIDIAPSEAVERVSLRQGHDFPATLVSSQFQALESPVGERGVLRVASSWPSAQQVDAALCWLGNAAAPVLAPPCFDQGAAPS